MLTSFPAFGTIVTLGGGGFSMSEDGHSLIDDHLIDLTGTEHPRVCFIPTASGDSPNYCERFQQAFTGRAHLLRVGRATSSARRLLCDDRRNKGLDTMVR